MLPFASILMFEEFNVNVPVVLMATASASPLPIVVAPLRVVEPVTVRPLFARIFPVTSTEDPFNVRGPVFPMDVAAEPVALMNVEPRIVFVPAPEPMFVVAAAPELMFVSPAIVVAPVTVNDFPAPGVKFASPADWATLPVTVTVEPVMFMRVPADVVKLRFCPPILMKRFVVNGTCVDVAPPSRY